MVLFSGEEDIAGKERKKIYGPISLAIDCVSANGSDKRGFDIGLQIRSKRGLANLPFLYTHELMIDNAVWHDWNVFSEPYEGSEVFDTCPDMGILWLIKDNEIIGLEGRGCPVYQMEQDENGKYWGKMLRRVESGERFLGGK